MPACAGMTNKNEVASSPFFVIPRKPESRRFFYFDGGNENPGFPHSRS
jgi:hypothetical protein